VRRGALAIGAAKGWFLIAGLGLNVVLPAAIGQASFGGFKRAQAFVNVVNNVIVVGSIQAVSRAVAGAPEESRPATLRHALAIHALIGLVLGVLFLAAVPLMVAHQHAPHLRGPLRTMGFILIAYGVYAPLVGGLNGVRAFGKQAALDATYSTLRVTLTCGIGWFFLTRGLGDGALGASVGFLATALVIVPIALAVTPVRGGERSTLVTRDHLAFLVGLLAMQAFQSLLLQVDIVVLGRAATLRLVSLGYAESIARAGADRLAGLYAQAQAFGLVPYQILLTASYVLFPAIAAARARGDVDAIRADVAKGGVATLVVAGLLAAGVAGAPASIMRLAFGRGGGDAFLVSDGAPILRLLALAHASTAVATVGATLVAASGRGKLAATFAFVVAVLAATGASLGARLAPDPGVSLGIWTAGGLFVGIFAGAVVVAIGVRQTLGSFVRPLTLLRVLVALVAALLVGDRVPIPASRLLCVLPPIVPPLVFLTALAILGEPLREIVGMRKRD